MNKLAMSMYICLLKQTNMNDANVTTAGTKDGMMISMLTYPSCKTLTGRRSFLRHRQHLVGRILRSDKFYGVITFVVQIETDVVFIEREIGVSEIGVGRKNEIEPQINLTRIIGGQNGVVRRTDDRSDGPKEKSACTKSRLISVSKNDLTSLLMFTIFILSISKECKDNVGDKNLRNVCPEDLLSYLAAN
uniref:Uncharacterized protein n=1 Tax=Romanomermis culicivorax TaxID=13658 RepID=A0A915JXS3_ROMCU